MWKEAAVLVILYALAIGSHEVGVWWKHRQEIKRRAELAAHDLDPISPLYDDRARPRSPSWWARCRKHGLAACLALLLHPATAETVKHYSIHYIIYSGYVLKGH